MMRVAIGFVMLARPALGTASARRCPAFTAKMLITLKIQHVEFNTTFGIVRKSLHNFSAQVRTRLERATVDYMLFQISLT
jgi:hypothetical protein